MFNCRFYRLYKFFIHSTIEFIICEICEANKALLCTAHPPARVRQILGFTKISGRLKTFSDGLSLFK